MSIGNWLSTLERILRSITSDQLATVELRGLQIPFDYDPEEAFAALDDLLSETSRFPQLRKVDVYPFVRGIDYIARAIVGREPAQNADELREWLPRLHQRGILYCGGEILIAHPFVY